MAAETFFANFGHLADAPNGVKKLRELILRLAVQGKLVEQDETDEPASILLERIKDKKEGLVKEGLFRKTKPAPPVSSENAPYQIHSEWQWVKLEAVADIGTGTTPSKTNPFYYAEEGVPWVTSSATSNNLIQDAKIYVTELALEKCRLRKYPPGTLVVALYGQGKTRGQVAELAIEATVNQACSTINVGDSFPELKSYIRILLEKQYDELRALAAGGAQPNLNVGKIRDILVPLPPQNEQKRIVAKVDQLITLCDELEVRQKKRQQGRIRLNNSALDAMLTSRKPNEFASHWQRICNNFDLLYDHPETITKLRAAILQLAVQGKLVHQDPNDEPASVLRERIKAEKKKLVNGRKYQKAASQPDLKQVEKAIGLPVGWVLSPIGELCPSIVPNRDKPKKFTGNIPWVTLPNLDKNSISINFYGNDLGLTPEEIYIYSARVIPNSSVIMSCVGRFGLCAVTSCELVINQQLHAFVILDQLDAKFIAYSIKAHSDYLGSIATSTTIKYLNKTKCESIPIFLPPREEQYRIVAKVDQLMVLCDKLEDKLNQAQQHSEKMMEATVKQLLVAQ